MEESQSTPAAEAAAGGQAEPTASVPPLSATGGPNSWEAAFAADGGTSNRGTDPTPEPEATAPSAASAPPDTDGASKPDGASADTDGDAPTPDDAGKPADRREPQPGSRRSTAAELEAQKAENEQLREQFETWAKERDEQRQQAEAKAKADADAQAEAQAAVEGILGKPGEMAQLLQKRASAQRTGQWGDFTQDDEDRLTRLTEGALLYQPLLERARAEAQATVGQSAEGRVREAEGRAQALLDAWAGQFDAMAALDLPAFDAAKVRATIDNLPGIVTAAHAAGAASRDGEIADLQGQLTDAKTRAFASQPHLATGGVSGNGRTAQGYDPTRSPVSNLEGLFAAEPAAAVPNGRR